MGKLVGGGTRFLLLCALLLLLPSLAGAQCPPAITVQRVWTQDTGGKDKTNFVPGETIQFGAMVSSNYGGSGQTLLSIKTSFYNDTKTVNIPLGSSTWTWNATTPSTPGNYTVTVQLIDPFCGMWVSRSATFAVGQGTGPSVILERALTHNGVGEIGQEQTTFAPGDTIRYAAIVNNPGSSTVTPRFVFQATGPREIFSWPGDVPIPPGIWYFHLHVSVPTDAPAGAYTLQVTMTYNGQTTTKQSSFTIGHTGTLPDLSSTAILYNPANLIPGGTVFFDSGVQNSGAQGTGVFNVRWFVDDVSVGYGSHAGVPANSTVLDGNSQFSWVATAGTHTITFAVDVDNHVVESDESNNSRSVTITVASQTAQPPVITLLGDNPLYHTQGCPFVGAGATALDAKDGDLTNSILITGTEQINNPGMHTITYTVTNSYRLPDTKTRQVIAFGAIGTPLCFVGKPAGKAPNLVIIVHGCCTDFNGVKEWDELGRLIAENIHATAPEQWEIVVWDWHKDKNIGVDQTPVPPLWDYDNYKDYVDIAYTYASVQGNELADAINRYSKYKYIHLLGHSAGAKLIDVATKKLAVDKKLKNQERPFIHLTFFDVYTRNAWEDTDNYGSLPNDYLNHYAEHYVDLTPSIIAPWTNMVLPHAFNFDITSWTSGKDGRDFGHQWPRYWYAHSVEFPDRTGVLGFSLSLEGDYKAYNTLSQRFEPGKSCQLTDVLTTAICGLNLP